MLNNFLLLGLPQALLPGEVHVCAGDDKSALTSRSPWTSESYDGRSWKCLTQSIRQVE